jgi:hypothetical protein
LRLEARGTDGKGVLASLYQHPRNGVLVLVANVGRGRTALHLSLRDQQHLTGPQPTVIDAIGGDSVAPLTAPEPVIALEIEPMGWRLLWFRRSGA